MSMNNTLTIFGRFSRNSDIGFIMQQPNYDSGADLPKAYWNIEFFGRIKTKMVTPISEIDMKKQWLYQTSHLKDVTKENMATTKYDTNQLQLPNNGKKAND
ncbi:16617_t:CDS:2 [Cetraspora pellucida]|uniref:16617_t:CDS:1 n=1 Tax=Cetraspora pellucida TaxID=1433469 RepID=A0A9N9FU79_9GLOM|nr:16617_t:CDS:2 [Cetraspora pellucida]